MESTERAPTGGGAGFGLWWTHRVAPAKIRRQTSVRRRDDGGAAGHGRDPHAGPRLRVFVSSTLAELADERAEVARAISSMRLTPVLFELVRPHPPPALPGLSRAVRHLHWPVLAAVRLGWAGYEHFGARGRVPLSHSLPRLLYVKTPAPDREPGLIAMLDELRTEGTEPYRTFGTPRESGDWCGTTLLCF